MREAQTEKEEALGMENYLAAEASCIKRDRLNQHMYELFVSVMGPLDHQLHQAWGSFATVLIKESEITETWAITAQQAMTERNEKLTKVDTSYRQHYETKLQTISTKRAEAEQEKSEIAFDLDMWEQSDSEFQEKISERVHNEQEEREKLLVKEQTLQEEINALVECVEQLKRQREGCIARLEQLESIVQEKTAEFAPEQSTHRDEYVSINKRMKDTEERCTELDQEGSELHYQLNQHTKEIERERELLKTKEKDTIDALGQAERNRKSATIIHHILFNTLETGDQVMKEKKQAIVQAQEAFLQYKKEIESLQHRVYTSQQKLDGLNETIEHTEFQLKSLSRQKRLAVENGQFQNAATAAARITAIEGSLEIATKKREVQEMKVIKAQETLKEYENKVFAVEREFTALEMEAGSIIVKELKKAKASIKETQTA
ncbi:hypothetical protein BDF14DRAFT_1827890 [Spinellus fusiger]|nr:hypothetical protein BDF14DRAFT_1827890 [Spinellus fusiger]